MTAKLSAELIAREILREMERHEQTIANAERDIEILSQRPAAEPVLHDIVVLTARKEIASACLTALKPLAENPPVPKS